MRDDVIMPLPPAVEQALARFAEAGYRAYLVGGCVRDALLHRPCIDFDLTTNALPQETARLFADCPCIETGLQHGTVTVLVGDMPLEITTHRKEGAYSDARHPDSVQFTQDLRADLARRDFTINALAYRPEEGLIDVFGGMADMRAGLLRTVGEAGLRFREDALRILRALRFASVLGFRLEEQTALAICAHASTLGQVSAERKQVELDKLLAGAGVGAVFRGYPAVFAQLFPWGDVVFRVHSRLERLACTLERTPKEGILPWAQLLFQLEQGAIEGTEVLEVVSRHYKFSKKRKKELGDLLALCHEAPILDEISLRWLYTQLDFFAVSGAISLKQANLCPESVQYDESLQHLAKVRKMAWTLWENKAYVRPCDLALGGHDVMALGLRGRAVGDALEAVFGAVVEKTVLNEKGELLAWLAKKQGRNGEVGEEMGKKCPEKGWFCQTIGKKG